MITNEEYTAEISGNKFIKRVNEDGSISFIPMDESNSDYQAYLEEQANDQSL
jgi:hypothetical protein